MVNTFDHEKKQTILLTEAFELLINESKSGKRVQPNGRKIATGTIKSYQSVLRLLREFEKHSNKRYEILIERNLSSTKNGAQVKYWRKFYHGYRRFLFSKQVNAHDNYVATHMKTIKLVFKYLRREKNKVIGMYEYLFYNVRIEPAIVCFPLDKLKEVLFTWKEYPISERQKQILGYFLFGISVGLRYSDLKQITAAHLEEIDSQIYLNCKSQKTGIVTKVSLPAFAVEILKLYPSRKKKGPLLSLPTVYQFNKNLKNVARIMGWDWPVVTYKSKFGKAIIDDSRKFHDIISSHMMRRTTITSLLTLGVPESAVRQISGHAKGSKEFYRYVQFSQAYIDQGTNKAWKKLLQ